MAWKRRIHLKPADGSAGNTSAGRTRPRSLLSADPCWQINRLVSALGCCDLDVMAWKLFLEFCPLESVG